MSLSQVSDRVKEVDDSLSEQQKFRGGAVLLVGGTVMIGMLAFVNLDVALQVIIGLMGIALMVLGTLSIGTSGIRGRPV
ncbi:hypothetical protein BRC94_04310 [Halobacteriales archaeon QS_5_70_17]|jgi:uncharacterized membrane protein HdeD (DUF308 family)|nr:MAG: hypothetical protein BRC94_04310 [Halobacteriales archaeon QS_5_70_17]